MDNSILIAMSGGLDSSVCATQLKEQGYHVNGAILVLNQVGVPLSAPFIMTQDLIDAQTVSNQLGITLDILDYREYFHKTVIQSFVKSYEKGITPNPCLLCNQYLKFGVLLEYAKSKGYDHIATGHYARIEYDGRLYHLKKALDPKKDQSYVLYHLTQDQLAHTLLPLGTQSKEDIRQYAIEHKLVTAQKKESQDICFVPDGDYAHVVESLGAKSTPGSFVDANGMVLGQHKGLIHYTIGQHKGLGLAFKEKHFVTNLDVEANQVVLEPEQALYKSSFILPACHFISGVAPTSPFEADVMLRYRKQPAKAYITPLQNGTCTIEFQEPQKSITPGQACVIYSNDEVLGGGIIPRF